MFMAGRVRQLGFEFTRVSLPSPASVELAAARARASIPRDGSPAPTRKARPHAACAADEPLRARAVDTSTRHSAHGHTLASASDELPRALVDNDSAQTRAAQDDAPSSDEPRRGLVDDASATARCVQEHALVSALDDPLRAGAADASGPTRDMQERALASASDELLCALADELEPVGSEQDEALAQALELALRARYGSQTTPLRLRVTDNVRTMVSLRRDKLRDQLEARVHHMFLRAPAEIWSALGDYLFGGEREAARSITRYIEQHRKHIRSPERRTVALSTRGRHHDLREICQAINERYFAGQVSVNITWARHQTGKPHSARRSIKLGSYTARDQLIRVHPALDAAFVPRYFIEYIVYHEMLHHVLPPKQQNGRRELHGPAFLARERQFRDYRAALQWERENLGKLLRRRARKATVER